MHSKICACFPHELISFLTRRPPNFHLFIMFLERDTTYLAAVLSSNSGGTSKFISFGPVQNLQLWLVFNIAFPLLMDEQRRRHQISWQKYEESKGRIHSTWTLCLPNLVR